MTTQFIALFRAARLLCHLAYGMLLSVVYPGLRLPTRQTILKRWSAELLEILHVRLEITGHPAPSHGQGSLLASNHISWLDVFAINAAQPSCFIAKSEVADWPLIGMLCRRTRTVFIERDIRRDTVRINRHIGEMLGEGEQVVLFPEGTSTDGTQLRHFHSSLFQSAIDCKAAIQPVVIHYHDGSGKHCDDAAFIGDMNFFQSLHKILSSPSLHVTLALLAPLSCEGKNRRILTAETQVAVGAILDKYAADSTAIEAFRPPPRTVFRSAYSLLLNPISKFRQRHSG